MWAYWFGSSVYWVECMYVVKWIYSFLTLSIFQNPSIGVLSNLFGALGLSVKGAKILIISVYPLHAAAWIGVSPSISGALGLFVRGTKLLTISVCQKMLQHELEYIQVYLEY